MTSKHITLLYALTLILPAAMVIAAPTADADCNLSGTCATTMLLARDTANCPGGTLRVLCYYYHGYGSGSGPGWVWVTFQIEPDGQTVHCESVTGSCDTPDGATPPVSSMPTSHRATTTAVLTGVPGVAVDNNDAIDC